MEFVVNVNSVKFIVDADDVSSASESVYDILQDVAFDWGQVSVA
jgi:hypothetical protein